MILSFNEIITIQTMAINLKQTLEAYSKKETFSVTETLELFDDSLVAQIADSKISEDLKKEFKNAYQEVGDTEYWEDWDSDCDYALQCIMNEFDGVIKKMVVEL